MAFAPRSEDHMRHYARFARAAYGYVGAVPPGYNRDDSLSNRNRVTYVNEDTKQVIIAFRGTDSKKMFSNGDFVADLSIATGTEALSSRFRNALKTTKAAQEKYAGYKLTATGHSLGAGSARFVAKRLGIPAVIYSEPTAPSRIKQEFLRNALGFGDNNVTSYTTLLDPIALGTNLAGNATIVQQTTKDPHGLANFLES